MKTTTTSLLIIFLVVLDQISKILISSYLSLGESLNLLPFLNFTLIHNTGIAFSIFGGGGLISRWLLVMAVSAVLAYLLFQMYKKTPKHQLELISLIFIISGGLGNLVDRVFLVMLWILFMFSIKITLFTCLTWQTVTLLWE